MVFICTRDFNEAHRLQKKLNNYNYTTPQLYPKANRAGWTRDNFGSFLQRGRRKTINPICLMTQTVSFTLLLYSSPSSQEQSGQVSVDQHGTCWWWLKIHSSCRSIIRHSSFTSISEVNSILTTIIHRHLHLLSEVNSILTSINIKSTFIIYIYYQKKAYHLYITSEVYLTLTSTVKSMITIYTYYLLQHLLILLQIPSIFTIILTGIFNIYICYHTYI